ncbi:hypothetical protein ACIHAA_31370 [Streptomyces sp. NPDC052040]|uniref:hypothetical protein n=1 Tax=Streptomyces sp. NPDC052040 TaxID=3365682 RepID=UPI0037CDD42F
MHRPSDEFASLGIPEVTKVGEDLDRLVVELLRVCGVDASETFATNAEHTRLHPA